MDPFTCGLLDKSDVGERFAIPIIRIAFAIRGKQDIVTHMKYSTPWEGASLDNVKSPVLYLTTIGALELVQTFSNQSGMYTSSGKDC